jgi:predicted metal-dependent peptidase
VTKNPEAELKIIKARVALLMKQPFFGTLALRLKMVEDNSINPPTMAVDGKHIFYHPQFVIDTPPHEVEFIMAHEVMHCVFDHMGRRNSRSPKKWNYAGDYVINAALQDAGFPVPANGLYNQAYAGMTTDQVYNLLPDMPEDGGGSGYDSVRDAPPSDPNDPTPTQSSDDWKVATVQAANAAKGRGKLPASLKRFVDEMVESKSDWRSRLRQFAVEQTKNDYSYARVNRRFASLGIFLPGLHSESMGTIAIVTDDSGSIGDDILKCFAGEIVSIRDAVRPQRTIVISCDARVNHVDDLEEYDLLEMKCHGGGGTDFRPPFDWLAERGITPACLIYLTDLYGPAPEEPPEYPVMWCCINDEVAPWGETIRIEP